MPRRRYDSVVVIATSSGVWVYDGGDAERIITAAANTLAAPKRKPKTLPRRRYD